MDFFLKLIAYLDKGLEWYNSPNMDHDKCCTWFFGMWLGMLWLITIMLGVMCWDDKYTSHISMCEFMYHYFSWAMNPVISRGYSYVLYHLFTSWEISNPYEISKGNTILFFINYLILSASFSLNMRNHMLNMLCAKNFSFHSLNYVLLLSFTCNFCVTFDFKNMSNLKILVSMILYFGLVFLSQQSLRHVF